LSVYFFSCEIHAFVTLFIINNNAKLEEEAF